MIIDLVFASGDLRIRTRSTPSLRYAVDLVRAVLALGTDVHLTVRANNEPLPGIEFEGDYSADDAIRELLRLTTDFETERGLAELMKQVKRDAKLPEAARQQMIENIAPVLAGSEQALPERFYFDPSMVDIELPNGETMPLTEYVATKKVK